MQALGNIFNLNVRHEHTIACCEHARNANPWQPRLRSIEIDTSAPRQIESNGIQQVRGVKKVGVPFCPPPPEGARSGALQSWYSMTSKPRCLSVTTTAALVLGDVVGFGRFATVPRFRNEIAALLAVDRGSEQHFLEGTEER